MSAARPSTVVVGLGNPMRRDDGVGPAATSILELDPPPGTEVVTLDGESTRLVEAWRDRDRAILVDAIANGDPPGTIHEIEIEGEAQWSHAVAHSTHGGGVAEAIALGRALDRLPGQIVVLGVEPGDVSHGPDLTPAVEAALAPLVERVRERATG